ncbi:hypothetical protein TNCV_3451071 [Trichonephila clavipes]|uniref:Uncharacterized protein n=1 Tax=Trichonephila clavipes TaxID=2585209 RepID=A0A8X6WLD3_TRICX|nr:hypothetical protein TNCV_3451071 [Trichonephila clavipes]
MFYVGTLSRTTPNRAGNPYPPKPVLRRQYDFAQFHPNFEEEHPGSGQVPSTTNLTRGLAAQQLFRVPSCTVKAL